MTYFIAYITLLFGEIFGSQSKRREQVTYYCLMLALFLFVGFRYQVGCDWGGYLVHYRLIDNDWRTVLTGVEPGYWGTLKLIQVLGLPYVALNLVMALIFFGGFHILASRQFRPIGFLMFAFPILVLNMPMAAIRQGAAIGLLCAALAMLIENRKLFFVVLTIVAAQFHGSAYIFLAFTFLDVVLRDWRYAVPALVASLIAASLFFNSEVYIRAADRYIESSLAASGAIYRTSILALTGGAFLLLFRKQWATTMPQTYQLALAGSAMMVALPSLLFLSSVIADRLGYYLIPIQLLILIHAHLFFQGKNRIAIYLAIFVGLGVVLVAWSQFSPHYQACYSDYQFVISQ